MEQYIKNNLSDITYAAESPTTKIDGCILGEVFDAI